MLAKTLRHARIARSRVGPSLLAIARPERDRTPLRPPGADADTQEGPYVLPDNCTPLQAGMVFHTPRTVRVYGDQTSIVSETVLITDRGAEVLTIGLERRLFRC